MKEQDRGVGLVCSCGNMRSCNPGFTLTVMALNPSFGRIDRIGSKFPDSKCT